MKPLVWKGKNMNYNIIDGGKTLIKAWTKGVSMEEEAAKQLSNLASLPFLFKHIAVMPDVHRGAGSTVGTVFATQGAIIPSAVGADIGCGMMAIQTSLMAGDLPDNLFLIRDAIEKAVPHGRTDNGGTNDRGAFGDSKDMGSDLRARLDAIIMAHPKLEKASRRAPHHLGTLGTGNHFIEICLDEEQRVWVMLHSGSRGIGNAIGSYFIERAKEDMKRWFIHLPDQDLAYLPTGSTNFHDYVNAVNWAQEFAMTNREKMMDATLLAFADAMDKPFTAGTVVVNCHHNYVAWENHFGQNVILTRKGAVRAREGDLGIIPGSMGAQSFIVKGKGNAESFHSCSHGAGRAMSRTEARRRFTLEDHERATRGVECRKDADVIDETPKAYKPIDKVMAAQADLVDIVHTLKQVICVKG